MMINNKKIYTTMYKTKILLTLLLSVIVQFALAQGKVISGTVEDAMGPVMMANVIERDANNRIVSATQTDMMGNFSMEIKNPKNKLVVSYVGSKTAVLNIGDQETFTIKLEDEKTTLNEVTVKGRRTNSGGLNIDQREVSISQQTFNLADVEGMAFTSIDEALQGEIAGLDIVSNSGNLGAGTTMRLNGVNTINGDANPLIVVNDKIFDYNPSDIDLENADEEAFSSLLAVNVEDIASITVLKDAAATAVWGAQGANGVIEIKTKRGSRGKPKVNMSYKFTGTWMPAGYNLLSGDNYTMMVKEAIYNRDPRPDATTNINEINYLPTWAAGYYNWNNNTDWVDAIKQFGDQHDINFNIAGGGQKATFRISAGYMHQNGTVIKQVYNRLTTRLALDYNVSERIKFSTDFALTYNDNTKNYTYEKDQKAGTSLAKDNAILAMAQQQAPNATIYRRNSDGSITDEYFLMNRTNGTLQSGDDGVGNVTSYQLGSVVGIGNPVAYANSSWLKEKVYTITPDFSLSYELLGTGNDQHRLKFDGRVYFNIYAYSRPTYMPASLNNGYYYSTINNFVTNIEENRFGTGASAKLTFTPHFKNEDFYNTMYAKYECGTTKYTYQKVVQNQIPNGLQSATVTGNMLSMTNQPGTTKSAWQNWIYNTHFSYKSRYNITFLIRGDGKSAYGPKNPWFYSTSISTRYNLSEEPFFEKLKKVVSMLGIRFSWGKSGNSSVAVDNYFNYYYNDGSAYGSIIPKAMNGMKLDDLRPEKKTGLNLGLNFGFLNDMITIDFDMYRNKTTDLLMKNIPIPTSASWNGATTLTWGNVGAMENKGYTLVVNGNKFIKAGKFSMSASFNMAQNSNKLTEMDKRVLDKMNTEPVYSLLGYDSRVTHVVVGDPMCSIYGYNCLGVYQYSYEYLQNYNTKQKQQLGDSWTTAAYEAQINQWLAEGKTFPVVTDENGRVIMQSNGQPQRMTYYSGSGSGTNGNDYQFNGGDAIYEDVNHDGTINQLDYKYLGNSLPKLQGGFSFTFNYGNWKLVARFNFRYGSKLVNIARMNLENMHGNTNQASSVTYRWRKDGDETVIPRALWQDGYNYQISSRFVEDGSFLRLNNLQISYTFPKKQIKKYGLQNLSAYVTMTNLFCWTKYSGIDPEVNAGAYTPSYDTSSTPRSKQVTATISMGF